MTENHTKSSKDKKQNPLDLFFKTISIFCRTSASPPSPAAPSAAPASPEAAAERGPLALDAGHLVVVVAPLPLVLLTVPVCGEKSFHRQRAKLCRWPGRRSRPSAALTSEVVPGIGRQARIFVLPAVIPGGRTLPGPLDHQRNPLLFVSCMRSQRCRGKLTIVACLLFSSSFNSGLTYCILFVIMKAFCRTAAGQQGAMRHLLELRGDYEDKQRE